MDLNNLSVFAAANQNIKYQTERQKVLAANVANANTPGYLPKDLKRPDFGTEFSTHLKMTVTNEKHLTGVSGSYGGYKVYTPKPSTALTIDGNGVVLEDQMNEISKSKGEYDRVITLYGKYQNMLNTANTKISG